MAAQTVGQRVTIGIRRRHRRANGDTRAGVLYRRAVRARPFEFGRKVADDPDILEVAAVMLAPPDMIAVHKTRFGALAHHIVQPDRITAIRDGRPEKRLRLSPIAQFAAYHSGIIISQAPAAFVAYGSPLADMKDLHPALKRPPRFVH